MCSNLSGFAFALSSRVCFQNSFASSDFKLFEVRFQKIEKNASVLLYSFLHRTGQRI